MLNYANLNDVEFEYLCQDIMSIKLGVNLQRFALGKDGGIDLTDDAYRKKIVVQVKHYTKTDIKGLIRSLKKEIPKVKNINPQQYYICCSKELTPHNKSEIYCLFADYMTSTDHIVSLLEIDEFLNKGENADILKKHFKLWIESTNVLINIFSKDVSIDCETLLSDIKDDEKLFVQTSAYDKAISILDRNDALMIIGDPGVGKTTISKMLVLYYAAHGYRIRYTTDGTNISALKRALSDSPDKKEIILLDDCFGQAYFNMKETQSDELLSLIKYVKINPCKKLIINSRVTIYQEAKNKNPQLEKSLKLQKYSIIVLDMNDLKNIEKAKILYNHLYFYNVPLKYLQQTKDNKNYWKIINHKNYNPRIIEYISNFENVKETSNDNYIEFVINCLDNPEQIWKNEFEHRISTVDRTMLTTLFSLTSTTISKELLKKSFNKRIETMSMVDTTINQFESSFSRLQNSFLKIVDRNGTCMVSATNPSVNDFLSSHLNENIPEKKAILESSVSIIQFERLLNKEQYESKLVKLFADYSILNYDFESERIKIAFITNYVSEHNILDLTYKEYIIAFLNNNQFTFNSNKYFFFHHRHICELIFAENFSLFYNLNDYLSKNIKIFYTILKIADIDEIVSITNDVLWMFEGECRIQFIKTITNILKDAIEAFFSDIEVSDYNIELNNIVSEHSYITEYGEEIDEDRIVYDVENEIENIAEDYLYDELYLLPEDIIISPDFIKKCYKCVYGASTLVKNYLNSNSDYDYYQKSNDDSDKDIDFMFDRL